jgi:TRAP transporter TAXI family solute receptor
MGGPGGDAIERPAGANPRLLRWGVIALAMAGVFALTRALSEPPPPKRLTLATGSAEGAYHKRGGELARSVERASGSQVEVRATAGSAENVRLLAERKADVAFVQGGVAASLANDADLSHLRAIARVYSEPLWVFYRGDKEIDLLADLRHPRRRIAIGPDGSGTQVVALELLRTNGISDQNASLFRMPVEQAAEAFQRGEVDVLFEVAAPTADTVQALLHAPGARLMNFANHRAYARRLPYLAAVDLDQGLLSLADNLPAKSIVLLSPSATLVTRDDVHPRVVELFTREAQSEFGDGNLIDLAGEFPSSRGLELPQHEAARRYLTEGESWASRHLSFQAARLLSTLKLVLIPLIAVLLPGLRLIPLLWRLRVNRLIKKHYEQLRDVEARMHASPTPEALEHELAALEALRAALAKVSERVPGTAQDSLYHWRTHVALVRQEGLERLERLRKELAAAAAS